MGVCSQSLCSSSLHCQTPTHSHWNQIKNVKIQSTQLQQPKELYCLNNSVIVPGNLSGYCLNKSMIHMTIEWTVGQRNHTAHPYRDNTGHLLERFNRFLSRLRHVFVGQTVDTGRTGCCTVCSIYWVVNIGSRHYWWRNMITMLQL